MSFLHGNAISLRSLFFFFRKEYVFFSRDPSGVPSSNTECIQASVSGFSVLSSLGSFPDRPFLFPPEVSLFVFSARVSLAQSSREQDTRLDSVTLEGTVYFNFRFTPSRLFQE